MGSIEKGEIGGIVSAGAVAGFLLVAWLRSRKKTQRSPEQIEAGRRAWLAKFGKLGGGEIVELVENTIFYQYEVRGVSYSASQDTSNLGAYLPEDSWLMIGGIGVRYDPRNPANSIILSETWSGLRKSPRVAGRG